MASDARWLKFQTLQRLPRHRTKSRRHEEYEAAGREVGVEQRVQDLGHVGVARVHLVYDEQVAEERAGTEMGVWYLEAAEQSLVDRTDHDLPAM